MKLSRLLPVLMGGGGRRFYVDATGGLDTNDGLSTATAWQTIGKVNAATFVPGDRILFKRGETWIDAGLVVPADSLVFDAYGVGALPIISAERTAAIAFDTNGKDHLSINNIHAKSGTSFGFAINNSNDISVNNIESSDCGNDGIIFTTNSYNIRGSVISSHDNYDGGSGARLSLLEIKDGCHDITLNGVTLENSTEAGLHIIGHSPLQGDEYPYNIRITNLSISNCGTAVTGYSIIIVKQDTGENTDRNIVIDGFTLGTGGSGNTGVYVSESATAGKLNGVILRNGVVDVLGAANQYPFQILGTVKIERTVFSGTYPSRVDNKGDLTLYNSVIYRGAADSLIVRGSPVSTLIRNSIIYSTGARVMDFQSITGTEDLDYNLYFSEAANPVTGTVYKWNGTLYNWADWLTTSSQDAHSPTPADPAFTAAATGDFTISALSPAIDAGVVIAGVTDGFLGDAPDCGYIETA